jgi:TonB family protein
MYKIIFLPIAVFLLVQCYYPQNSPEIKGGIVNGKATVLPIPDYPNEAVEKCAGGIIEVRVEIDEQGAVISAEAVSGNKILFDSAVAAARKAKFSTSGHPPIKISGIIVYNFERLVKCIKVGIVNRKALNIPPPKLSNIIHPKHLKLSKTLYIQVRVVVNPTTGNVIDAKVLNAHPLLRTALISSARLTKFAPAFINSKPIFVRGTIVYKINPDGRVETKISEKIISGEAINLPIPHCPTGLERCLKQTEKVTVEVEINETGYVTAAESLSGHPLLRAAAVAAARRARFTPTYENEKAVRATAVIEYGFSPTGADKNTAEVISIGVRRMVISGHFLVGVKRIFEPKVEYPAAAKFANIKGKVEVRVLVDEFGKVEKAEIVSGHRLLQKAALEAARSIKFESPKLSSGTPVKVSGVITFEFN